MAIHHHWVVAFHFAGRQLNRRGGQGAKGYRLSISGIQGRWGHLGEVAHHTLFLLMWSGSRV